MNPLRWIEYLALEIQGARRCPTPKKLLRYMEGKNVEALHFWVQARMWYEPDGSKPWRQNWTPLEQVLARDVPGKDIETDCEELSVVKKFTINSLGWGRAENLVVWADNNTMGEGTNKRTWCHASCLAWTPKALTLMDYNLHRLPRGASVEEAVRTLGQDFRVTPTRWCFCADNGVKTTEIFKVPA